MWLMATILDNTGIDRQLVKGQTARLRRIGNVGFSSFLVQGPTYLKSIETPKNFCLCGLYLSRFIILRKTEKFKLF